MRRVIVRQSSVHGKGVFAMRQLKAGERVLEYRGEITSWPYIPQVEDTIWREFRCQSGGRMPIQGRRVA